MRMPLTEISPGSTVTVAEIQAGDCAQGRLAALGIRPGVRIRKVSELLGRGPVVLEAGGAQTALGWGLCHKILVEAAP